MQNEVTAPGQMPKKGIHPVVRSITYVLKNGASVELPTVLNRQLPYTLQRWLTPGREVLASPVDLQQQGCDTADPDTLLYRIPPQTPSGRERKKHRQVLLASQPR